MKNLYFISLLTLALLQLSLPGCDQSKKNEHDQEDRKEVWSITRAREWADITPWLRGANFIPSTAINQLEMWQQGSFDPETIDRELGWAQDIGFNCMRVYLHHLAWQADKEGFKQRMDQYLNIAENHGIKTIFVFFDDCWDAEYKIGAQPRPEPGVHNSGWVRDPGDLLFRDPELVDTLESYVKEILQRFSNDERVVLWDLYNEPGNNGLKMRSMPLLKKVFAWSREVRPSQPVSAGVWNAHLPEFNRFQLENSDVITYHNYQDEEHHKMSIDTLKSYNRPMICTEYMARTRDSRFENIMPLLKENNIGAINWGLVSGKTNTIYAWDTPVPDGSEPKVWFHDIFRKDGSAFDPDEIKVIKKLTGKSGS